MPLARMQQGSMPLVTAVIPVYNHEKYVAESIRSTIDQSYPNIELIVINDGSKDRSHEMVLTLVDECKQRFVRFEYINRENRGLTATLNQALTMSEGKYLALHASDDMILPDKYSCLVEALESIEEDYAGAFGNASFIDQQGREIYPDAGGRLLHKKSDETYSNVLDFYTRDRDFDYRAEFGTYRTLVAATYLPTLSSLLKTAKIKEVGGWTAGSVLEEDWEMWLKLSKQHRFLFIDRILAAYRLHGKNSLDTMKPQLLQASLTLLLREREYCARNGLTRVWKDSFYGRLYWVLRYGNAPIKEKLNELKRLELADVFSIPVFLAKTGYKTLFRKISGTK